MYNLPLFASVLLRWVLQDHGCWLGKQHEGYCVTRDKQGRFEGLPENKAITRFGPSSQLVEEIHWKYSSNISKVKSGMDQYKSYKARQEKRLREEMKRNEQRKRSEEERKAITEYEAEVNARKARKRKIQQRKRMRGNLEGWSISCVSVCGGVGV